jgi:hypothetical protein
MSSGRRAQNLLNLKIARSAPVFRDYLKLASVVESKVLFHARNKMFVAIQTHNHARTCACVPAFGFRVLFRIALCGLRGRRASSIGHLDDTFDVGIPPPIKITVSIGVSEFGRDGDTLDSFWVSPISGSTARNVKVVIA